MAKIRTFVAVDISMAVQSLADKTIAELRPVAGDYRWSESKNFHLTTNFTGDIHEREVPELCACVKKACAGFSEFALEFGGLGAFPRPDRPRVLWLGVQEGLADLVELQRALADRLFDDMGFPPDRKDYSPHLTLGRLNHSNGWKPELLGLLDGECAETAPTATSFVDEVIVYSSYMEKHGPTYTPMATIELE